LLKKLEETLKNQFLASASLRAVIREVRKSMGAQSLEAAGYSALYHAGPPAVMVIRIPGPVFSLNLDLHGSVPLDRLVYGSNREWWHGEIGAALATISAEAWHPFDCAGLIITEGDCDLDNIGIKTLVDGLKDFGIIKDDNIAGVSFILVRHPPEPRTFVEVMVVDAAPIAEEFESIYAKLAQPFCLPNTSIIASSSDNPFDI
jgi:hypothetical protein